MPGFTAVTEAGIHAGLYDSVRKSDVNATDTELQDHAWSEALKYTAAPAELKMVMQQLGESFPAPEVGFDLRNGQSEVLGELEWAWHEQKVGWVADLTPDFSVDGWIIFTASELDKLVQRLNKLHA